MPKTFLLEMAGIVRNPSIAGGLPIVRGTGLLTEDLADRFVAGESIAEIVADYPITPEEVERAIRFELKRRIKRMH